MKGTTHVRTPNLGATREIVVRVGAKVGDPIRSVSDGQCPSACYEGRYEKQKGGQDK